MYLECSLVFINWFSILFTYPILLIFKFQWTFSVTSSEKKCLQYYVLYIKILYSFLGILTRIFNNGILYLIK